MTTFQHLLETSKPKHYNFWHYIDSDNFRLTPDVAKIEVDCMVKDGTCTVTRIYFTPDLLRCIRSFTELCNEIELEAESLYLPAVVY